MPKYKVVNETEFAFEKECQNLIDQGYRPCSGIATYEKPKYDHYYSYRNIQTIHFVQSFMNNTDKES